MSIKCIRGAWLVCFAGLFVVDVAAPAAEVTFTKDVAPILWKNCARCHRPGDIGPFSLLNYQDAAKRAEFIAEIVTSRRMPPWKPEPGYGDFVDDLRLSDAEIQVLSAWAKAGAPEGKPQDLPPAPEFPTGWQLGEPDMVVRMPQEFEVPSAGRDVFRCFVIPLDCDADRTVAAVDFHPGNRRVVHHALFYLDNSGQARKLDEKDSGPGYPSFGGIGFIPSGSIGGWAPGAIPRRWPEGLGNLLRKGSDLVLQVHYHPSGKPETDQSELGIYFTPKFATHIVAALIMGRTDIDIPAGATAHEIKSSVTLPHDLQAVGVSPHMHWLGREMKVDAFLPDGSTQPLLWIKDWDFNWQGRYVYREEISLPKGTRIELAARYDNSSGNPSNPHTPPKDVHFGEQTTDEMCFCWVHFTAANRAAYGETMKAGWQAIMAQRWSGLLGGAPRTTPPPPAK
jgi:mono/diheme cytochrome c family protein